jgi:hypothetical protein
MTDCIPLWPLLCWSLTLACLVLTAWLILAGARRGPL